MEEIKPLLVWSNIFGLLPFVTKQQNEKKHKILQRSLFFWCFLVLLFQLFELGALLYILRKDTLVVSESRDLTAVLSMIASHASSLLSNFLPRFICLRSSHFKAALDHLRNFLSLTGKQQDTLASIRKRVFMGFFAGFIWFAADFGIVLSYLSAISEDEAKTLRYLTLISRCASYGHQIFTYVSLYALAHLLAQRITVIQEQFGKTFTSEETEPYLLGTVAFQNYVVVRANKSRYRNGPSKVSQINLVRNLVDRVHWAGEELVHTFSPIILLMLIVKLITIVTMLIRLVGWLLKVVNTTRVELKSTDSAGIAYVIMQLLIDVLLLLTVFHVADIPVQKMSTLKKTIADYDAEDLTLEEKTDLNMLLQRISAERVQLTAGGLFGVGKHLLPGITGTIITYIVILMQAGGTQLKNQ